MATRKSIFIPVIWNKRREEKRTNETRTCNNVEYFTINLNKYNASLLVTTLSYTLRQLYYGKVEDVKFEHYFNGQCFDDIFFQLRTLMFLLNENCKNNFIDYEEYKIIK